MVEYNPFDWKHHDDPYPVYRALREEAPAYYNPEHDFWALSRHEDVIAAFRDPETYSSGQGVTLEPMPDDVTAQQLASFLAMDPPKHDDVRGLIWRRFTRRRVKELEGPVRALATLYLDRIAGNGQCDFIQDFAAKVPMDVISEMLDVPEADRDQLRHWADTVVHREDLQDIAPPAAVEAGMNLLQYFGAHVMKRKAEPKGDLVDDVVHAQIDGEPLNDIDTIAVHFLLAIAGNETTTKLLGNALYWLWKNPDQRKLVEKDPTLIPGWVDETLRYDASSQMVARTLTRDVEVHGKTMKKGQKVALLIGSANRDDRVFDDPDRFDVRRKASATLAFGHGTHFCLGASLARLEGRICLEEVMKRIPTFDVQPDGMKRMYASNVRGLSSLPIRF